jgi:hypothetical protein
MYGNNLSLRQKAGGRLSAEGKPADLSGERIDPPRPARPQGETGTFSMAARTGPPSAYDGREARPQNASLLPVLWDFTTKSAKKAFKSR